MLDDLLNMEMDWPEFPLAGPKVGRSFEKTRVKAKELFVQPADGALPKIVHLLLPLIGAMNSKRDSVLEALDGLRSKGAPIPDLSELKPYWKMKDPQASAVDEQIKQIYQTAEGRELSDAEGMAVQDLQVKKTEMKENRRERMEAIARRIVPVDKLREVVSEAIEADDAVYQIKNYLEGGYLTGLGQEITALQGQLNGSAPVKLISRETSIIFISQMIDGCIEELRPIMEMIDRLAYKPEQASSHDPHKRERDLYADSIEGVKMGVESMQQFLGNVKKVINIATPETGHAR